MNSLCFSCKKNLGTNFYSGKRECSLCSLKRKHPKKHQYVIKLLERIKNERVEEQLNDNNNHKEEVKT